MKRKILKNIKDKVIHENNGILIVRAALGAVGDATGGMRREVDNARPLRACREGGSV